MKYLNIAHLFLCLILLQLLNGCSSSDISGTGSQAGNGIVTAVVLYEDSTVAENAEIYVRSTNYLKDTASNVVEDYITKIDNHGKMTIEMDPDSEFVIEIRDNKGYATLVHCSTNAYKGDSLDFDTLFMVKEAMFFGKVDLTNIPDYVPVYVQVYGMDKIEKVDHEGNFKFDKMPAGTYKVKILPAHQDYEPIDDQKIALGPNDSLEMSTILLHQDFWKDTLIIRDILDLNNLDTLSVDDVVERDSIGRINKLILIDRGIDTLPQQIGMLRLNTLILSGNNLSSIPFEIDKIQSLEYLDLARNNISKLVWTIVELRNLRYLDLSENSLDSLPEGLGKLRFLSHLACRENVLKSIPETIGMIEHLLTLDLYNNELRDLPAKITYLKDLENLDVRYNKLFSLSYELENWINTYSVNEDWKVTQSQ